MSRFNELLNTGALLSRGLGIGLGLQEQEGVLTSAPELMPVYSLDGDIDRYLLGGGKLITGFMQGLAAGGAGFRSQIAVDNPADSNQLVILERVSLVPGGAETLTMSWSNVQLTGSTGNLVARDGRTAQVIGGVMTMTHGSAARLRTQNNTALANILTTINLLICSATLVNNYDVNIIIPPGFNVRFYPSADNTAIVSILNFWLRARPVNPRELSGL